MEKIKKQNKLLLGIILLAIVLMGIGYASITKNILSITGEASATATKTFDVYYTGEVPNKNTSESYITVEANPVAKSQNATVNILGLSKKDDYGFAILEIENGSTDIDAKSITVTTNATSTDIFKIDVIMCDVNGNSITNYEVASGAKTYAKIFAQLLKTPTEAVETTISAVITATPVEEKEPDPIIPEPEDPEKSDLFYAHYAKAREKMENMTQDEKIAQMFVIGTSSKTDYAKLNQYQFGGHLYLLSSFKNTSGTVLKVNTIKKQIQTSQNASKIPLLMAIDEEGETVSRLNKTLYTELKSGVMPDKFKDSSALFSEGGLDRIKQDTIYKSNVLTHLGFNLNFAPDVDITEQYARDDKGQYIYENGEKVENYMYKRTLKQDADTTAKFAKAVIETGKSTGVSYSLKHFPGYGNSADTHGAAVDDLRPLSEFESKDLIPFQGGIDAGAEVVMVAHNVVKCFDETNPASISKNIHNYLRNDMHYTGIIITDAINMGAVSDKYTTKQAIIKAIKSGNDMICLVMDDGITQGTKDTAPLTYSGIIKYVSDAVEAGTISQDTIDTAVRRILAWKYYKGLM